MTCAAASGAKCVHILASVPSDLRPHTHTRKRTHKRARAHERVLSGKRGGAARAACSREMARGKGGRAMAAQAGWHE